MYDNDLEADDACPSDFDHQQLLDEKLPPARNEQLMEHLQKCLKCQTTCERLLSQLDDGPHTTFDNVDTLQQVSRIVELVRRKTPAKEIDVVRDDEQAGIESGDLDHLQLEYSLIRELGRGGQGLVYLASDIALSRSVVIKLLTPRLLSSQDSMERFRREARSVASLQSKFVVPIYRVGSLPSGRLYMVMEYVEGATLRQLQQQSSPFSFQQIARIVQHIARGLSDAHGKRLVHRDIKPENILIQSKDSVARIVDFGLAFDVEDDARITVDGAIAGTPAYMSPEQVSDPKSVDSSTDIYSLGVVLYELLTGEVPFRGTARMTLLRVMNEDAVAPSVYNEKVPRDLETICLRAMSKDRSSRFRTASHLAEELERFLGGQPIESRPNGSLERLWRKMKKNPAISTLICSVILLGTILTSVSVYAAVHLNSLNKQIVDQATIANQQRDAALATLGDLTVQLQQKFDDPDVFIEEIQQSSLEIALRGLEKMQGMAGQSFEGGLARAIALRRLGQTLFRLGKEDASIECIEKSEHLLQGLLASQSLDKNVVLAFADTVLAREECCVIEDEEAWTELLARAINYCNSIPTKENDLATKACELLTCQAESQLRQNLLDEAERTLLRGMEIAAVHWNGKELPSEAELRDVILCNQLCKLDLLRVQGADYRNFASRLLDQVMAVPDVDYVDSVLLEAKFSLLESLGLLAADDFALPAGKWRESFSSQMEKLVLWAKAGSDDYAVCSEVLACLSSYRLDIGLDESARDLLRLRVWLAEQRLEQSASDRFALLEKFDSHAALASIEFEFPKNERKSFNYCLSAIQAFDRLAVINCVGNPEWFSITDILAILVDLEEDATTARHWWSNQARESLRKIDHWMGDSEATASASISDIERSRELMQILRREFDKQ